MSFLTQFGIVNESEEELVNAMTITDEISVLLQQQGIDPSFVNRLHIPAGFSSVGSITILCYLPPEIEWNEEELWAVAGPIKWKLSNNYSIHRIFANKYEDAGGLVNTLSVVTFDDWRYNINFFGSNTTQEKTKNSYKEDFSVYNPDNPEVEVTEENGDPPHIFADLSDAELHLYFGPSNDPEIPSLNDKMNAWGYDTSLSRAVMVDRVLSSCGIVAIPYPHWREGAENWIGYTDSYDIPISESHYMVASYIGEGWRGASQSWDNLKDFYINGQLQCVWGTPETFSQTLNAEDDMESYLNEVPETPVATNWTAQPKDGSQGIPQFVDVQFPAKSPDGKIILYRISSVTHGLPNSPDASYTHGEILTDHIKTKSEDVSTNPSGITIVDIDPEDYTSIEGIDEERAIQLAERALRLSRNYYARYYACTGQWLMQGFQLPRPYSGQLDLSYGFNGGVPYTEISSDIDDARYGFNKTSFAKTSTVSSGGVMMSRPDGMLDLSLVGGGGASDILAEITSVELDAIACVALYGIRRLSDSASWESLRPTTREIPNMCYAPATVGDLCLFAIHPEVDDPNNPQCGQGVCEYVLIVNEKVKTIECM